MKGKHTSLFLIVLAICILGVCGYIFLFSSIGKGVKQIVANTEEVALLSRRDEDIRTQQKLIEASQEKRDALGRYFLSEQDLVPFLGSLEFLGTQTTTDLKIASVNALTTAEGSTTPVLAVSLDAKGTYSNLFYLLSSIESLPYEIAFTETTFSHQDSTDTSLGSWRMTTTLHILSFIPQGL